MFKNDYSDIAHINVLKALLKYEGEQNEGYGLDYHSKNAADKIKEIFDVPTADIHFLTGGTQVNMVAISKVLMPYEGVICCDSGHINVHETAAVEGSGHKVMAFPAENGKLNPEDIYKACKLCYWEHMVKLKMVYITDATETGSIYTLAELKAIRKACDDNHLLLFLDGARLGVALTAEGNDITPADLGKYCDAFYIGGTKNGLSSGEAVVLINEEFKKDFRYHEKNKGAMLAKGFVLGIEFEAAFTDNLYFEMAKNSNVTAKYIKEHLAGKVSMPYDSLTNQQFIRLPRKKAEMVMEKFGCEMWEDLGEDLVIRIVTSFKTKLRECDELIDFILNV